MLRFVHDGIVPGDSRTMGMVLGKRDKFVLFDVVLFHVDPLRRDQVRLVLQEILRKELTEEMHVGGFSGYSVVKDEWEAYNACGVCLQTLTNSAMGASRVQHTMV